MDKTTTEPAATAPGRAAQGREPRTTGSPAIDNLRRRAGIREYTCGLCGEEFGSNCAPGDIQCTGDECEARLCPCCGAWFTEDGDHSHADERDSLTGRVAELSAALAEAASHVEPADQNSELAIARWQALAARQET